MNKILTTGMIMACCAMNAIADTQKVEVAPDDSVKSAVFKAVTDGDTKTFTTLPKSKAPDLGNPGLVVTFVKEESRMIAWGRQAQLDWMVSVNMPEEFTVKSPPMPAGASSWVVCTGKFSQVLITDDAWKKIPDKIPWKSDLTQSGDNKLVLILFNAYPQENCSAHLRIVKSIKDNLKDGGASVVVGFMGAEYRGEPLAGGLMGHTLLDLGDVGHSVDRLSQLDLFFEREIPNGSKATKLYWLGHGSSADANDTGLSLGDPTGNGKSLAPFIKHGDELKSLFSYLAKKQQIVDDFVVEFHSCHSASVNKAYSANGGVCVAQESKKTLTDLGCSNSKSIGLDGDVLEGLSFKIPILGYLSLNQPLEYSGPGTWISY